MDDPESERWKIDFDVAKSVRYHAYRRSFWQMLDNCAKVLTVVSGAAVLVAFNEQHHLIAKISAFVVAITAAADVVLGFSTKARLHDSLYRHFCRLGLEIAERTNPTEGDISRWWHRRLEIEMDEPGIYDWLERRCSAEEARARGAEVNPAWKLPKWKIYLSQLAFWPSAPHQD